MIPQATLKLSTKFARCWGVCIKNRLFVFFAGLLLFSVGLLFYDNYSLGAGALKENHDHTLRTNNRTIRHHPACTIPQLEPFHESIQDLVQNKTLPLRFNCGAHRAILFNSTMRSTIVPAKEPDYFRKEGYEFCCYRTVERDTAGVGILDNFEFISAECLPISLTNETKIPDPHEFIAIYCKKRSDLYEVLKDVHAFVPLKQRSSGSKNKTMGGNFNLVIFGMDAMSRMNFLRAMPESYSFLKNEMGAVEMIGYNKVGENTAPNIFPLLMSGIPEESPCYNGSYLDDCPFIWKEYSKKGYYTLCSEDMSPLSIFTSNRRWGYLRQPTDYYPRPLSHFADSNFPRTCFGPRLTFQFLLDYMEKHVDTMSRNKKTFFQFTWSAGLTHDYLNGAILGDPHLLKSLRWMKESGHLKNTIFILMSDHGARMGTIRNTIQGQLEDRLPFMYFVLPDSFKTKYKLAYRNLLYNADKLMTTYDLHESLKDILNLEMIGNRKLLKREAGLLRLGRKLTRGISLFLPIPEFRTCEMAGIKITFCSCIHSDFTHVKSVNVSNPEIINLTKVAVSHINAILGVNNPDCALLHLNNVRMAWKADGTVNKWDGYTIHFQTKPGGGQFEAMVLKGIEEGTWIVQDPIVRTNRYGNQSHCVQDMKLKPYCYCLK